MRANNFTQNMLKKSNAELENILEDKKMYTDEAIQAVIWELENRNIIEKGSITHNLAILEKDVLIEEKELDKANHEASSEATVFPILYSKRAIQGFTIFFSTLFGAVLLMSNLKKMNKPKARVEVLVFGISYTFLTIILLDYLPKTFFLTILFNLVGYAVLVEYFWNKNLGKELQHQKKQISKPLIISFAILVLLVLLQFYIVI
ncbi:MAG: hypothetical protein QMB95_00975 [Polaribacter sp.]|jgi:hypothetical protein|tara:strand:- start:1513 stop:2124 length:612 start_codon:yes stop_codon:yes gene_type:complete